LVSGRGDRGERVHIEAPGAEEVVVVPWPILFRERVAQRIREGDNERWWVLWTTLAGLFSVGFTITILTVSLSRIAADLHSDTATLTWIITGPLLAFGVVGPALGRAGDIWGQKRIYLLGLTGAIVFAGLTAVAWSAASLITFRVLGAAEGAATGSASMALIMRAFPEGDRVKAMGWWSLVGAGAPVLGVVAGGPIVEHLSWRLIFVAQVPLTMIALVAAALVLPDTERGEREPLDLPGALALAAAVTALLFGLNRGPVWGWDNVAVIAAFVCSPLALLAFIAIERRAAFPLMPLAWFARRNFSVPIAVQFFLNFAYMGSFILTPLFLDEAFGYGETQIGLLTIARPLSFSLSAPAAGYLAVRLGERTAAIAGALFVCASALFWQTVEPGSPAVAIMAALALAGVGLGVALPSMAATVANAVEDEHLGIAGAAQQLITQVGVVAGIQIAQTVQAARESEAGLVASYHEAYLLAGVVALLGLVAALFVRRTPRGEREREPMTSEAVEAFATQ
jgi:EmrB/QacA subfamily drug resistance transporter